ncbi:MAG: FAD-binding oxidoreductase [Deltaproteobacteria bacterium]|nr:FAD-binding oxidoreductase [Deltaproteobacteria bacterium]
MVQIKNLSWGRYPRVQQRSLELDWLEGVSVPEGRESVLPYGMGRSYGDSCLNAGGLLLVTRRLNRLISFDNESGLVRCECGVTLADLAEWGLKRGWFLPVTPGTKFVTVGGAIANDVHGKNHHRAGTFGAHVPRFELLRSNGERLICSADQNNALYRATIGGLGLTGLITWAEVRLRRAPNAFIDMQSVKFGSLEEFFQISGESDQDYEYTVAWMDCVSTGANFGRGIFMRGNHSSKESRDLPRVPIKLPLKVPFDLPSFTLNNFTVRAFDACYYHKQRAAVVNKTCYYDPFFYPLDAVEDWNRIYGKRGFLQFQCVVPGRLEQSGIKTILEVIVKSGSASFLAVVKEFGSAVSAGMLSFPTAGVTLCLDFPNQGARTLDLFQKLYGMTCSMGGRVYPAKDACMSPGNFQTFYPGWREFAEHVDPRFSSSFWRRVTEQEAA